MCAPSHPLSLHEFQLRSTPCKTTTKFKYRRGTCRMREQPTRSVCTFCGRGADAIRRLLVGPEVGVCEECVGAVRKELAATAPLPASPGANAPACGFCGKSRGHGVRVIEGARHHICEECIELCADMLQ